MDKQTTDPGAAKQPPPGRRVDPLVMMTAALGLVLLAFAAIVAI